MKKNIFSTLILLLSIVFVSQAQVYSDKVVGKKKQQEIDSLKTNVWPHLLPIGGKKVTALGFELPKPLGFSAQYLHQESDIVIDNLMVGFNGGQMFNLDEVVRFNNTKAITDGINVRPDIWVLPFLNVYGIFAQSTNQTEVDFGIYVPGNFEQGADGDLTWGWTEAANMSTTATFQATTYGFGMTPTVGIAGGFFALDMNWTWTDIPELSKPASAFVFGPRIGKSFKFGKPEQSLAVWVGGFRVNIGSETSGSLNINELFPDWEDKINTGIDKVDDSQVKVNDWWSNLSIGEKAKPSNIAKKAAADKAIGIASTVLDAGSRAESVEYSLEKRQANMWNFIVGSQYQLNKNWMIRGEMGFLGARTQFIGGLQYRFGL